MVSVLEEPMLPPASTTTIKRLYRRIFDADRIDPHRFFMFLRNPRRNFHSGNLTTALGAAGGSPPCGTARCVNAGSVRACSDGWTSCRVGRSSRSECPACRKQMAKSFLKKIEITVIFFTSSIFLLFLHRENRGLRPDMIFAGEKPSESSLSKLGK